MRVGFFFLTHILWLLNLEIAFLQRCSGLTLLSNFNFYYLPVTFNENLNP